MTKVNDLLEQSVPLFISVISIYEVYYGIIANSYLKGGRPARVPELLSAYTQFLLKCQVLDFTQDAAEKAADLLARSQGQGTPIKEKDCQIAGTALAYGVPEVLTRDESDFKKIYEITGLNYILPGAS